MITNFESEMNESNDYGLSFEYSLKDLDEPEDFCSPFQKWNEFDIDYEKSDIFAEHPKIRQLEQGTHIQRYGSIGNAKYL